MPKKFLLLVVLLLLVVASPSTAAAPPAKQITALKRQVAALKHQVATLRTERDAARSQLAQAQTGTTGALSTMTAYQLADTVLPTVYQVFDAAHTSWLRDVLCQPYTSGSMGRTVSGDGTVSYSYDFWVDSTRAGC